MAGNPRDILVTGASGFVGQALVTRLAADDRYRAIAAVRPGHDIRGSIVREVSDIDPGTDWTHCLSGVDTVIHTAARVHVMNDVEADPIAEFRRVNCAGTLQLARQAAFSGIRRFIFISSIKVNGEGTTPGGSYRADDVPAPIDPYGISKMEAEIGLKRLAAESAMEIVIIRPVLVYGPGVKANFRAMMNWLSRRVPLPLGAIANKRSLVALDNLVDLILVCIDHPAAANETFLVSDDEDLSTTELLHRMGFALGRPARLFPVSAALLDFGARMAGRGAVSQRLCGSLQVDIGKTRALLGWTPPVKVDEALRKTAQHFLESKQA